MTVTAHLAALAHAGQGRDEQLRELADAVRSNLFGRWGTLSDGEVDAVAFLRRHLKQVLNQHHQTAASSAAPAPHDGGSVDVAGGGTDELTARSEQRRTRTAFRDLGWQGDYVPGHGKHFRAKKFAAAGTIVVYAETLDDLLGLVAQLSGAVAAPAAPVAA